MPIATDPRRYTYKTTLPFPRVLAVFFSATGVRVDGQTMLTALTGCMTLIIGCAFYMLGLPTTSRPTSSVGGGRPLPWRDIQTLHSLGAQAIENHGADNPYALAISVMASDVVKAIDSVIQKWRIFNVASNSERAAEHGKALSFPASPSDLLPIGASLCMHTLLEERMSRDDAAKTMAIIPLVSSIVRACISEALPTIITSTTLVPALETIVRSLMNYFLRTTSNAGGDKCMNVLSNVTRFFIHLSDVCLSEIEYTACVTADNDESFIRMCDIVIRISEGSHQSALPSHQREQLSRLAGQFKSLGAQVLRVANEPAQRWRVHPSLTQHAASRTSCMANFSPWRNLGGAEIFRFANVPANGWRVHPSLTQCAAGYSDIKAFLPHTAWRNCLIMIKSERCYAPHCMETYSSIRRKFKRCAKCNWVPYCSRACQLAAWDDPVAPHRQICRALHAFSAIGQIPNHAGRDLSGKLLSTTKLLYQVPVDVINNVVHNTERLFEQKLLAMASLSQYGEQLNQWFSRRQHLLSSGTRLDVTVTKMPDDDSNDI